MEEPFDSAGGADILFQKPGCNGEGDEVLKGAGAGNHIARLGVFGRLGDSWTRLGIGTKKRIAGVLDWSWSRSATAKATMVQLLTVTLLLRLWYLRDLFVFLLVHGAEKGLLWIASASQSNWIWMNSCNIRATFYASPSQVKSGLYKPNCAT